MFRADEQKSHIRLNREPRTLRNKVKFHAAGNALRQIMRLLGSLSVLAWGDLCWSVSCVLLRNGPESQWISVLNEYHAEK